MTVLSYSEGEQRLWAKLAPLLLCCCYAGLAGDAVVMFTSLTVFDLGIVAVFVATVVHSVCCLSYLCRNRPSAFLVFLQSLSLLVVLPIGNRIVTIWNIPFVSV